MNNLMPRLIALGTAMTFLAGCAMDHIEGGGCLPVPAYNRQFLAKAAEELRQLPPGASIEQMLADYQVMRDQVRACR